MASINAMGRRPGVQVFVALALSAGSVIAGELSQQSYYDASPVPAPYAPRPPAPPAQAATPRKVFTTDSESNAPSGAPTSSPPPTTANATPQSGQPELPPNMERGVKDLETGMEELQKYTGVMATHIQQNGLRGFLAIPPAIRDQGIAVGRKIGNGINGIATDTAHDMVAPERR